MKIIVRSILSFLKGILFYYEANMFIFRHKLWHYLIFPGFFGILYMISLFIIGILIFPDLSVYLNETVAPDTLKGDGMVIGISVFLWLLTGIIGYISYQQIILILFSPVLSHISNLTEHILSNNSWQGYSLLQFVKSVFRSFILNLKNIFRMALFGGIASMFVFFPIVGLFVTPIMIILILSYYCGFGLIDFSLDRKEYSASDSSKFNRENRALTTGIGFGFCMLLFIPFLGWMTAPGYGAVASTLAAIEETDDNEKYKRKS